MSTREKPPTLAEVTYHYLGLHKKRARKADYEDAEDMFRSTLQRTRSPQEIRAALALDSARKLPVQLKSPAYERLLILQGRTPALLREYAQEMYDFGPEFIHYADTLWDEADEIEEGAEF
jgi:hypothetical protein